MARKQFQREDKFSLSVPLEIYREHYGENTYWSYGKGLSFQESIIIIYADMIFPRIDCVI